MKKLIVMILASLFLFIGCVTPRQQLKITEGELLRTGKTRVEVMDALVRLLTEEGYVVDNINEKYGIISCQPYDILTGQLWKKIGVPGGGGLLAFSASKHTIKFSANVMESGDVRIRTMALEMEEKNIFSPMLGKHTPIVEKVDAFTTERLNKYFVKKLQERLEESK